MANTKITLVAKPSIIELNAFASSIYTHVIKDEFKTCTFTANASVPSLILTVSNLDDLLINIGEIGTANTGAEFTTGTIDFVITSATQSDAYLLQTMLRSFVSNTGGGKARWGLYRTSKEYSELSAEQKKAKPGFMVVANNDIYYAPKNDGLAPSLEQPVDMKKLLNEDDKSELMSIINGRRSAYVITSKADIDFTNKKFTPKGSSTAILFSSLQVGDTVYSEETNAPDYWYNGETLIEQEVSTSFLTAYYTKSETDNKFATNAALEATNSLLVTANSNITTNSQNITKLANTVETKVPFANANIVKFMGEQVSGVNYGDALDEFLHPNYKHYLKEAVHQAMDMFGEDSTQINELLHDVDSYFENVNRLYTTEDINYNFPKIGYIVTGDMQNKYHATTSYVTAVHLDAVSGIIYTLHVANEAKNLANNYWRTFITEDLDTPYNFDPTTDEGSKMLSASAGHVLKGLIDQEISDRSSAISSEASARASAITAEVTARNKAIQDSILDSYAGYTGSTKKSLSANKGKDLDERLTAATTTANSALSKANANASSITSANSSISNINNTLSGQETSISRLESSVEIIETAIASCISTLDMGIYQ